MSERVVQVENIPLCLCERPQWVCWKYVPKASGKPGKLPLHPLSGYQTDVTDSANWKSFEVALDAYQRDTKFDGVAYAFADSDPYAGVDLDDCLDEHGEFLWGKDIVDALDSYCEVSPSGRGVKIFLEPRKPAGAGCVIKHQGPDGIGKIEVYSRARCFATTGRRLASSPTGVMARQAELDALCAKLWPPKAKSTERPTPDRSVSRDRELLKRMRSCYQKIQAMKVADKGDGSHRLFSACCRCVEFDLPEEAALRVLAKYTRHQPFPSVWSKNAVLKRLRSAEDKVERGAACKDVERIRSSMLSVAQLLHNNPELRPPVIHGLLRSGETMNVIAPPKYGKSWLVTDLAMAVTTGRRWLDAFDTVAGNVLILDNELHPETSANRIPKVATARGLALEEIADKLFVDNLRGRLLDIYSLQPYFESLKSNFFKIIILDAFYRFIPKDSDENSNASMTDVYNRLDWYAAMLGCSFVLVHHASKGNQSGKSVTDVGAGAGSQARATDTHLVMRQHMEDECVVVDAAVRSWQPIQPLCLRWSFPVWNVDDTLDPADLRPERPRRKPAPKSEKPAESAWTAERFAESFLSHEPVATKTLIALARQERLSQRQSKELIQMAEDAGLIHRWTFGANRPVKFATIPQSELSLLEV